MESTGGGAAEPEGKPVIGIRLGSRTLTGPPAVLALLLLAGAIVALLVFVAPPLAWSPLWISAALWLGFTAYWSAAARDAAPIRSAESPGSRQRHALLLNLGLVLLFWRAPGLGGRWVGDVPSLVVAGLALHVASFLLAVWARRHLGRNWSGVIAEKVDHQLVRSGPYRRLRHPIYTAMLGMYVGTALVGGRWHGVVAVALVLVAYARKIPLEERQMRATFGEEYEAYRRASWALVPGVV